MQEPKGFPENTAMWFKVASAAGGLLTIAFLAWAGVVWTGWQDVRAILFDMHSTIVRLEQVVENAVQDQQEMKAEFRRHSDDPWHDKAGDSIRELQIRLDNHEETGHRFRKNGAQ